MSPVRIVLVVALVGMVGVVYGASLGFGFMQDDYFLLRPWSAAEIHSVFHGPYDPQGREPVFYRPLCSVWYAAMFWLFGLNATALHAVSLVIVTTLSLLVASVITRETGSRNLGLAGAAFLLVHPALAISSVAWITSQHVFLGMICAVSALRVWQWCRTGSDWRWVALVPPVGAGLLLREDVVMTVPAMLIAQAVRARLVGDMAPPRARLVGAIAATLAAAFAVRFWLLGGLGGYGFFPTVWGLFANWQRGPRHALLTPTADVSGSLASSLIVATIFVLGSILLWRHGAPRARALWVMGMALLACTNLPLFQFATPMRFGLMTTLAIFALTPAAAALAAFLHARAGRVVTVTVVAVALLVLGWTSRHAINEWDTCDSPEVEQQLADEAAMTPDIARFLRSIVARCAAGTFARLNDEAPVLAWGVNGAQTDPMMQLSGDSATWLIAPAAKMARVRIRATGANGDRAPSLRWRTEAGAETVVRLDSAEWRDLTIPLETNWLTRLRARHRLDLRVETEVNASIELTPLEID